MSEQLKFFKGNETDLPSVFEPGAIYHCLDTGNTYLAIDSSTLTLYSNTFKIYKQNEAPANPKEGTLWLDLDEESSSENLLPEITDNDNGKFLRVGNGAWAASSIPNAEGADF